MDRFQQRLSAGEVLFEKGDKGDCAYVIESGAIEICHDPRSASAVVARLGAQDIFGEMALFGEGIRSAGARATEPTVLTRITHDHLAERLQTASPMLRHLLRTLSGRCRELLNGKAAPHSPAVEDNPDRELALGRVHAEQELMMALEQEQLELYFQPIVRLSDRRLGGFESLLRWRHPQRGMVSPAEFIPLAEESGLIQPIGRWIIERACAALAQLAAQHADPGLFMSINLSGRQFDDPQLLPALDLALVRYGVAAAQVKLEITESVLLEKLDLALPLLHHCRARGVRICLDDFGTGYSSLSYLHRLPVDTLKLDRSFILQLDINAAGSKIVAAVIRLAHQLDLDVIAEGLETEEQISALQALGADFGQGFHFSRPVPLETAAEIVRKSL